MRGDVGVLKRLDRKQRRADRSSVRLARKLARTMRNKRRALFPTVHVPSATSAVFASVCDCGKSAAIKAVLRRCMRAKSDGVRCFVGSMWMDGLEQAGGVLVMPKVAEASPTALFRIASKGSLDATGDVSSRLSQSRVLLCTAAASSVPIDTGGSKGRALFVRRLDMPNGCAAFYATAEDEEQSGASPRALGLDMPTYLKLQETAVRLLGAQRVE